MSALDDYADYEIKHNPAKPIASTDVEQAPVSDEWRAAVDGFRAIAIERYEEGRWRKGQDGASNSEARFNYLCSVLEIGLPWEMVEDACVGLPFFDRPENFSVDVTSAIARHNHRDLKCKDAQCPNARRDKRAELEVLTAAIEARFPKAESGPKPAWHAMFVNGATFALDVPQDVPPVWGEGDLIAWAQGEALMLCGPQGVGKTTLIGQVAMGRLGLIEKVLGLPVVPGNGRVLYLACDRPQQARRSMHRLMRKEWRLILQERLVVWEGPPPADFAKNRELMAEMAESVGADTIIVDSLKDVAIGLKDDEVGASYNSARQIAIRAGVQVCELHHQVKRGPQGVAPTTLADVYGSVWLTSGAGSVILLWGNAGDPVVQLKHLKQPVDEIGPFEVNHDHYSGTSTVYHEINLLQEASAREDGITAKEAACLVFHKEKPTSAEVEKARRRLEKLAESGLLLIKPGVRGGASTAYHALRLNHGSNHVDEPHG